MAFRAMKNFFLAEDSDGFGTPTNSAPGNLIQGSSSRECEGGADYKQSLIIRGKKYEIV